MGKNIEIYIDDMVVKSKMVAIWSLTEGLKLTPIRLKLLTTCDLLGIPRKCRN